VLLLVLLLGEVVGKSMEGVDVGVDSDASDETSVGFSSQDACKVLAAYITASEMVPFSISSSASILVVDALAPVVVVVVFADAAAMILRVSDPRLNNRGHTSRNDVR